MFCVNLQPTIGELWPPYTNATEAIYATPAKDAGSVKAFCIFKVLFTQSQHLIKFISQRQSISLSSEADALSYSILF